MARSSGNYLLKCKKPSAAAPRSSTSRAGASKATTLKTGTRPKPRSFANRPLTCVRRAVVVNIEGVVYTGEYDSTAADGYTPGEWKPGDPVPVRLCRRQTLPPPPQRPGTETTIVKRIG